MLLKNTKAIWRYTVCNSTYHWQPRIIDTKNINHGNKNSFINGVSPRGFTYSDVTEPIPDRQR
jgi:hypothetical protein